MAPYDQIPEPDPSQLNENFLLGEILDQIEFSHFADAFPGVAIKKLISGLNDIRNHHVDPEEHLRNFLEVFWGTRLFQSEFEKLDGDTQKKMRAFKDKKTQHEVLSASAACPSPRTDDLKPDFFLPPSPAVKQHFTNLAEDIHDFFHPHHRAVEGGESAEVTSQATARSLPEIWEDAAESQLMEVHASVPFENWGKSVSNTPRYTFVPKTILGLQNLVVWAKARNLRVRVGGYRHSWSSSFSQDDQVLISLLNLEEVNRVPDPMSISAEYIDPANELKVIQVVDAQRGIAEGMSVEAGKGLVRVGVSVTNEQFRRWAVKNNTWSFPVDVILVEVTIGGVNGPICHGAGRAHKTISDQVRAIEYVDANGIHRKITNAAHLKAASGSFGLLGVVTHITFAVDPMSYAILAPTKPPTGLAVPPPASDLSQIPIALRRSWTPAQLAAAEKTFEENATNAYYAEYFWFTYQQTTWVNVWNTTPDGTEAEEYPSPFQTWLQWVEGWLGGIITSSPFFNALPGRWQAQLLATSGMVALPPFSFSEQGAQTKPENEITTPLPNALHFRRGIQNMRVRDMEFQIPIPYKKGTTDPDLDIVKRSWWDIINLVYGGSETPMRLTLEMRIMGGSDIIMAPQRGNEWGTASIEVLSVPDAVADGEWTDFCQQVTDIWTSYADDEGRPLNARPHWAKEWEHVNIHGVPARQYLRETAYRDAIREFKEVLGDIGAGQGWTLDDLQKRFSNELWDDVVFHPENDTSAAAAAMAAAASTEAPPAYESVGLAVPGHGHGSEAGEGSVSGSSANGSSDVEIEHVSVVVGSKERVAEATIGMVKTL